MTAGEAQAPRTVMPRAFKAVFYRLVFFFVLGSLAVGILVPSNDPDLIAAFKEGKPGAASSPYVVAMKRFAFLPLHFPIPATFAGYILTYGIDSIYQPSPT